MAISIATASASLMAPFPSTFLSRPAAATRRGRRFRRQARVTLNFGHFGDVISKDVEFLKKKIGRGMEWASEALHVPQVAKTLDDALWLRQLEDPPGAPPLPPCPLPQPYYPEFSGVDLFMADLKALEAYAGYFYYVSKRWSKPLPEVYDPEEVTDYFSCRPHLVALRLLEIFSSFATAAIRIRTTGTRNLLGSSLNENDVESTSRNNFGIVLKETMLNLGPTFIKVGQSLSTRPDIIGPEISKALSELHDQIPPFPRPVAMKIIEEELGSPVGSYFSYISEEPVAAASFGQVYRGRTSDGTHVAIKVQRPNLRRVVVRDVYILRLGMGLLQKIAKRKSDLRLYVDELGKGLVGELDYTLEAANTLEFMEAHSSFTFMHVPKVYQHLSGKRILTMEWMVGDSPTNLISVSTSKSVDHGSTYTERQKCEAKRRLLDLVSKGVEASLVQLLETGLLHADPHPGNLRYTSSGQIGFLDFGLVCRMEKKHQYAMLASIVHIVNGDWASLVQALTEMDVIRPGTNTFRVTMDLEDALGEVEWKDGIPDVKFSRVLGQIWSVALKYHFRMPAYYTLVLRSLASLEGLAVAGDEHFKTFEAAYPYVVRKLLTENSPPMRKILHSVVLDKNKELRWDRLALFLRVGSTGKGLNVAVTSSGEASVDHSPNKPNGVFNVANLILQLLPSKDGVVLRRLLMTVDGASLIRAMVSKEAASYREQFCKVVGDFLYQWMAVALGKAASARHYRSRAKLASESDIKEPGSSTRLFKPSYDYESLLNDRRLKVIAVKVIGSLRRDPMLTLRFCWMSLVVAVTASALACQKVLVSLSEARTSPVPFAPKLYAIRG